MGRLPHRCPDRETERHALLAQRPDRQRQLHANRQGAGEGETDAVIDGELVAIDAHGISRFQLLQNALRTAANLRYCAFDIMFLGGKDLRGLPLVERKERLRRCCPRTRCSSTASTCRSTASVLQGGGEGRALRKSWPNAPRAATSPARAARTG